MKDRKKLINIIIMAAYAGIIALICLWNVGKLNGPMIMPDEVGYWSSGYFFAGVQWNGVMFFCPYYGWGYGLILGPLSMIFKDTTMLYKAAIMVNVVLLVGSFFVACRVAAMMFPKIRKFYRATVCFGISLYTANVFQSQTTFVEIVLLFFSWTALYLICKIVQTKKIRYMVLLALNLAYLYAAHQRTIGMIIAAVIVIALLWLGKKLGWKQVAAFAGTLVVLVIMVMVVKKEVVAQVYQSGAKVAINDFSGQTYKMSYILTPQGFLSLCMNVIARCMYLASATMMMFFMGLFVTGKDTVLSVINWIKTKKPQGKADSVAESWEIKLFIFIDIMFAVGISAIFMIVGANFDHLLYGRYNEHALGPVIMVALLSIPTMKRKMAAIVYGIFTVYHMISSYGVFIYAKAKEMGIPSRYTITGVYNVWMPESLAPGDDNYMFRYTIWASLIAVILGLVILTLLLFKKVWISMIAIAIMSASWCYMALSLANSAFYSLEENQQMMADFGEQVEEITDGKPVYYVLDAEDYNTNIFWNLYRGKYFMPRVDIRVITTEELEETGKDNYIIINWNKGLNDGYAPDHKILTKAIALVLYSPSISNGYVVE